MAKPTSRQKLLILTNESIGIVAPRPTEQPRAPTVSDLVSPTAPPATAAQTAPPSGLLTAVGRGVPVIETVTAYEVRQEKDKELRENDAFWGRKLKELEARVNSLLPLFQNHAFQKHQYHSGTFD